jgi:hypothetical protein
MARIAGTRVVHGMATQAFILIGLLLALIALLPKFDRWTK